MKHNKNITRKNDHFWMKKALVQARESALLGEIPVGAVLVRNDELLFAAGNRPISNHDPTGHAEVLALRGGALATENYRLPDTTLYVTLEPCVMCMGAIIHSRIKRLVLGASDPKTGAAGSIYNIGSDGLLNHNLIVLRGILEEECGQLLRDFFRRRRLKKKNAI